MSADAERLARVVAILDKACYGDADGRDPEFGLTVKENAFVKAEVRSLAAALAAATADNEKLLGIGTDFPLVDVLTKLREAAVILLDDKDYDGHGWEQLQRAREVAGGYIALASRVPRPDDDALREAGKLRGRFDIPQPDPKATE